MCVSDIGQAGLLRAVDALSTIEQDQSVPFASISQEFVHACSVFLVRCGIDFSMLCTEQWTAQMIGHYAMLLVHPTGSNTDVPVGCLQAA
jgi:hypothetical protein